MPILIMCSNTACGEIFHAPDEAAGKKVRCPACDTVQAVPGAETAPEAHEDRPVEPLPQRETETDQPPEVPDLELADDEPTAPAPEQHPASPAPPAEEEDEDEEEVFEAFEAGGDRTGAAEPAREEPPAEAGPPDLLDALGPATEPAPPQPPQPPAGEVEPEPDLTPSEWEPTAPGTQASGSDTLKAIAAELDEDEQDESAGTGSLLADDLDALAEAEESADEGALEDRRAMVLIFLIGLVGMAAGLLAGAFWFADNALIGAYGGAALGWVAGFILSFLLVLTSDRGETVRVRCSRCSNVYPAGTETCAACGAKLSGPHFNPTTVECLRAGDYARANKMLLAGMAVLTAGGYVCLRAVGVALNSSISQTLRPWETGLWAAAGLVAFLICCYWARLLLGAIRQTVEQPHSRPKAPSLFELGENLTAGVKTVGVLVVFALPLITLPLLPLALLMLAVRGKTGPFNLPGLLQIVLTRLKDYVILWLMILVWGAGMVLCIVLALAVCGLTDLIPKIDLESARIALTLALAGVISAVIGAIACGFGLAIFRSIACFARHSASAVLPRTGGSDAPVRARPRRRKVKIPAARPDTEDDTDRPEVADPPDGPEAPENVRG